MPIARLSDSIQNTECMQLCLSYGIHIAEDSKNLTATHLFQREDHHNLHDRGRRLGAAVAAARADGRQDAPLPLLAVSGKNINYAKVELL